MNTDTDRDPTLKHERFAAAFSEALRTTVNARSEGAWESRVALSPESDTQPALDSDSCVVTLQLGGDLTGELLLSTTAEFARKVHAQGAEESAEEGQAAWLDIVESSRQSLETALGALFSRVSVEGCRSSTIPDDVLPFAELQLQSSTLGAGTILLLARPALRASLQRIAIDSPITTDMLPVGEGGHLHRVIDVPLAVTLRFGQRQLTLRELLALSTGSLLELDRQVEEPVDLMLGERIVARGEVVIVDGNYGMRVTQIVENASQRSATAPR